MSFDNKGTIGNKTITAYIRITFSLCNQVLTFIRSFGQFGNQYLLFFFIRVHDFPIRETKSLHKVK